MYATQRTGNFTLAVKKVKKRDEVSSVTTKKESPVYYEPRTRGTISLSLSLALFFFFFFLFQNFPPLLLHLQRLPKEYVYVVRVTSESRLRLKREIGVSLKASRSLRRNPDPEPRTQNRNARLISLFARATESVSSFLRGEPGLLLFRSFSRI